MCCASKATLLSHFISFCVFFSFADAVSHRAHGQFARMCPHPCQGLQIGEDAGTVYYS